MEETKLEQKMSDLELEHKKKELEDRDNLRDTQRSMAWYALIGMLLYPIAVMGSSFFGLEKAADILGSMAGTYFMSTAAIVMALFGSEAYIKNKKG